MLLQDKHRQPVGHADRARLAGSPRLRPADGCAPDGPRDPDKIKRPLADELLFGKLVNGGKVNIDVRDDELVVETRPSRSACCVTVE